MLTVGGAVYRQVLATLAACFIMMSCGTFFGWVAPTFVNLLSEESEIPMTSSEASWAISIIEFGNLWSPIPAGILADRFGRKPVALINGPISILSWLIILYFKSLPSLCIGRILQGFVIGNVFTVVPMYLGEISSQNIRGAIVTLSQACFRLGFVFEYVIGPFVSFNSLILCTICLPFAFLVLFPFQPESPHFYSMHEDHENAKKSLMWLRGTTNENDVKNELLEIRESVRDEMSKKVSFADITATPTDRRALAIVLTVSAIKHMSGISPILAYSTIIYQKTKFTLIPPYMMTIITGLVLLFSAFFSTTLIDSAGRKPLLIISCIGCSFSLAVVSAFFFVEMFPAHTRSTAGSLNTLVFTFGAFIALKLYQVIVDAFGEYAIFLLFSTCSFFGGIWLYIYAIETKNKSFVEIQKQLSNM